MHLFTSNGVGAFVSTMRRPLTYLFACLALLLAGTASERLAYSEPAI